ncbi:hypothetical protein [Stigmatella aurantiaca]|uniref:Y4BN n=1 Tax=Stigmatella aurantiaca (strain DW4/3-1) TaxID=378806 RepID=Q094P2_STIAD|nr:hypothetical protein [Stigmatella aurantiaca]ADO75402.1 uncharacterized protein STAUR_7647 [Stigmatella aurantiaca DW4/3-1]EAU67197.1 Y4BN [Stigmatella aurantiaca DW4/3-1]
MHLHALPWTEDILRDLGDTEVDLRVTLSYFIEPLPGKRGYAQNQRHRYASHGLRFELKAALESLTEFTVRINKAARAAGEKAASESDAKQWLFGPELLSAGSLHSDRWRGTAVNLAQKGSSPSTRRWDGGRSGLGSGREIPAPDMRWWSPFGLRK